MQQQATIAAAHHREAKTDKARGPIAEFVRNPVPVVDGVVAEQGAGDFAMGGAGGRPSSPRKASMRRTRRAGERAAGLGPDFGLFSARQRRTAAVARQAARIRRQKLAAMARRQSGSPLPWPSLKRLYHALAPSFAFEEIAHRVRFPDCKTGRTCVTD